MVRSTLAITLTVTALLVNGCDSAATKQMADQAASATAAASSAAADASAGVGDLMSQATAALSGVEGGSEMLKQVTEMFGKVTSTLGSVQDADSAGAALPELSKLTEGFGGMSELFGQMPDGAKSAVAGVFKSSIEQLQPVIAKVLAIPGVEAVLKPAIDAMMSKLDAFKA